jgi:hypothetical protein
LGKQVRVASCAPKGSERNAAGSPRDVLADTCAIIESSAT